MNERVERLREAASDAEPGISTERAELLTRFYRENEGKHPVPVMRALALPGPVREQDDLHRRGRADRGRARPRAQGGAHLPRADLPHRRGPAHRWTAARRPATAWRTRTSHVYEREVIPYWQGRTHAGPRLRPRARTLARRLRGRASSPSSWSSARRATPRSTARSTARACSTTRREIAARLRRARLPERSASRRTRTSSCGPWTSPATRRSSSPSATPSWPRSWPPRETGPARRARAATHRRGLPPRAGPCARATSTRRSRCTGSCHLGTITELNGWDAMNPGHLDQHLRPVLRARSGRRHPRPGTGQGAARLPLDQVQQPPGAAQGGRHRQGERHLQRLHQHQPRRARPRRRGRGRASSRYLILEVVDEIHLLQPQANVQISARPRTASSRPPAG